MLESLAHRGSTFWYLIGFIPFNTIKKKKESVGYYENCKMSILNEKKGRG